MRWRLQNDLNYMYTHRVRLTNTKGGPLYDMVFATDHDAGHRILRSVYRKAAERFPQMRQEARARRRDKREAEVGNERLFASLDALSSAPTEAH